MRLAGQQTPSAPIVLRTPQGGHGSVGSPDESDAGIRAWAPAADLSLRVHVPPAVPACSAVRASRNDRNVTIVTDDPTAVPPQPGEPDLDDAGATVEPGSEPTVAIATVRAADGGDVVAGAEDDDSSGPTTAPHDMAGAVTSEGSRGTGSTTGTDAEPVRMVRDGQPMAPVGADAVVPLDSRITQSRVGGLVGGLAGLALLRPWLWSGELLVRDLAAVADPVVNLDALTRGLGPTSDLLGQSLAVVVGQFVGLDMVVRFCLVVAFVALGAGAGRLAGTNGSRVAAAVAGMAAVWNPFVWARLNQGEWLSIVAFAALPWIVIHLRADHRWRLARATLFAGLAGAAGWSIALPTLVVVAIVTRRFRAAIPAALVLVVSAVPAVLAAGSFASDPVAFEAMSAVPDLRTGLLTSIITGGAHWNAAVVAESRDTWPVALLALAVTAGAVYGAGRWREAPRLLHDWRARSGLVLAALIGLVSVVVLATSAGRAVVAGASELVPWVAIVRNSTNLLAPWVLVLAIGLGHLSWRAVSWLRREPLRGTPVAARRLTAHGMAILGIVVVVLMMPDPQFGDRLPEPGSVPPSWSLAAEIVNEDPSAGSILMVPGDRSQDFEWANVVVTPPLQPLMATNVLVDSQWEVVRDGSVLVVDDDPPSPEGVAAGPTAPPVDLPGATPSPSESSVVIDPSEVGDTPRPTTTGPTSEVVRTLASQWPDSLDARTLAELGVGWVAVVQPERFAVPDGGLVQVLEAPEIQLVQVDPESFRVAEVERGVGIVLVDGLIATLAVALLLAAGPLRTGREMDPV